jgi:hypothetical protein
VTICAGRLAEAGEAYDDDNFYNKVVSKRNSQLVSVQGNK